MRVRARHYATGRPVEIVCDRRVIASVGAPSKESADAEADVADGLAAETLLGFCVFLFRLILALGLHELSSTSVVI